MRTEQKRKDIENPSCMYFHYQHTWWHRKGLICNSVFTDALSCQSMVSEVDVYLIGLKGILVQGDIEKELLFKIKKTAEF